MAKKKKKSPRLTNQQRKLVKNLAQGMDTATAGIRAGYSPNNIGQSVHQAMEGIRAKMADVLDRHGLTDDILIEKYLRPLLGAHITKLFAHEGQIRDSRLLRDNTTRLNALDLAFKLKGSYAPKTEEEAHIAQQFLGPTVIVLDIPRPKRPEV
jgi:hypothetical protein